MPETETEVIVSIEIINIYVGKPKHLHADSFFFRDIVTAWELLAASSKRPKERTQRANSVPQGEEESW